MELYAFYTDISVSLFTLDCKGNGDTFLTPFPMPDASTNFSQQQILSWMDRQEDLAWSVLESSPHIQHPRSTWRHPSRSLVTLLSGPSIPAAMALWGPGMNLDDTKTGLPGRVVRNGPGVTITNWVLGIKARMSSRLV